MALTLARLSGPRKRRRRAPRIQARKRALLASGHTYMELARLAGVTHSMVWKFMNGERTSAAVERAFASLTANGKRP